MNLKRGHFIFILHICPLLVYGTIDISDTGTQIIGEKLVLTCTLSSFSGSASWNQNGNLRSTCTPTFCTVYTYGTYTTFTHGSNHINVTFDPVDSSIDGVWKCTHSILGSASFTVTAMNETQTTSQTPATSQTPGSEDTNTKPDNDKSDGKATSIGIGILTGIVVIAYIIVIVMVARRLSIMSTGETSCNCFLTFCQFIEEKFFDCCGNKNSKKYWLLGFVYLVLYGVIVGLIVLLAVYYGFAGFQEGLVIGVGIGIVLVLSGICLLVVWMLKKFFNNDASKNFRLECCISLMSDTVTPHDRQQPDGDEGIQSTPTEIHTRLSTTPRPLPPRPDIASKPQGTLDSLNSHIPIVLAPIENPNIPPSIDTLDEQKTDKKPKDKKKKKKKKKDVEQDNPGTGQ